MRFGLGCMRLSTEADRDELRALETLSCALAAGITVLDTAHGYGLGESDTGHNERLIARALAGFDAGAGAPRVRVLTKCGMRRDGGGWVPDGRARRIAEDVDASALALGSVPIDVLFLHAPDPRVALATSGRALARAQERGQARSVGVSNVSRKQLEEIASYAPIAAVQVAIGAYDDLAIRGGVVGYCLERGIEVFAHAPLGGPRRAPRLARDPLLVRVAAARAARSATESAGPLDVFLAYLLATRPELVPVVGARRPETVTRLVTASSLALEDAELTKLDARFPVLGALRCPPLGVGGRSRAVGSRAPAEVVLMMGVAGAGKSRAAEAFVERGYERLNRDTLGGTLRGIARRLDERLRDGAERLVLDNTYVTRAARNDVLRVAHARGAAVRCVFFDTRATDVHVNVVSRMLDRFGRLLEPGELKARAKEDPAALGPNAVMRMTRDLEAPAADEGFDAIEVVPFVRAFAGSAGRLGAAVALDAAAAAGANVADVVARAQPGAACLLYAWRPDADDASVERDHARARDVGAATARTVETAICRHASGPPTCWCRPPMPGLWLAFARRHDVDVRRSVLFGSSAADRAMAQTLAMTFEPIARS